MTAQPTPPVLRLDPTAVTWRRVDDEVVALDLRRSSYLGINPTGRVLWQLLADGATREALAAELCGAFDVDEARAAADVEAFLDDLASRGLLVEE